VSTHTFEPVPANITQKIVAEAQREDEEGE
jgi:hypothetical protein